MKTTIKWNGRTIILEGGKVFVEAFNFERDGFIQATNFTRKNIKHMLRTGEVTTA